MRSTSPVGHMSLMTTEPIVAEAGTRLGQLAWTYATLTPEFKDIEERLKAAKDGLKSEMAQQRPGEKSVTLISEHLEKPLKLIAKTTNRVDTKLLLEEFPQIHAFCLKATTSWELRQA